MFGEELEARAMMAQRPPTHTHTSPGQNPGRVPPNPASYPAKNRGANASEANGSV
ncbi:uncharacterized protein GLRG_08369 [Colletotrichum graminicola M1.001]|uniref:Uncharacterized protein n=1 Tax=Colletotrichum graminicola (strain M1.001 / M2 / FGSC 10212) TaxID=645133 RepID=E3QQT7_COLGM|nr:uncharacterized protein GLRG_08369 [Colletotrichum graminicola M1.001]EFQ33225.1 hypothetical protein GLRG_08369 [Colletotrichum graminicola M1.001]